MVLANPAHRYLRIGIAVLVCISCIVLSVWLYDPLFPLDDAYITFRYARNLANGTGLVYNAGERVLSTTTPLLAGLLGLIGTLFPNLPLAGYIIGVVSLGGIAWFTSSLLDLWGYRIARIVIVPLILFFPKFALTFGNESLLLICLGTSGLFFYFRGRLILSAVLLSLCALTRGEGVIPGVIVLVHFMWQRKAFPPLHVMAVYAIVLLSWYGFATFYFGSPLPKTLYIKMLQGNSHWIGFTRGLLIRASETLASPGPSLLLLTVVGLVSVYSKREIGLFPLWIATYTICYSMLGVAGYHWYYAPVYYGVLVLSAVGIDFIFGMPSSNIQSVLGVVTFTLSLLLPITKEYGLLTNELPKKRLYKSIGMWIDEHTPQEATIGVGELGVVGYYANRVMVDAYGLIRPQYLSSPYDLGHAHMISTFHPDIWVVVERMEDPTELRIWSRDGLSNLSDGYYYILHHSIIEPDDCESDCLVAQIRKRVDVEQSYISFLEDYKDSVGTQRTFGPGVWSYQDNTYPMLNMAPFKSAPSTSTWTDVSISHSAVLRFGLGIDPDAWDKNTDGATFTVQCDQSPVFSFYLSPHINPYHRDILDFEIGLADYAGQDVDITFMVAPNLDDSYDWTGWVNPRIVTSSQAYDTESDAATSCGEPDMECLSSKTRNDPGDVEAWLQLASLYEKENLWAEAFGAYVNAAILGGTSSHRVGDIYYEAGGVYGNHIRKGYCGDPLIDVFSRATASDSFSSPETKADSYRRRGEAHWCDKELDLAIDDFESAIQAMPGHYWAHVRLGVVTYQRDQDLGTAESILERAIALSPQDPWGYWYLGEVYRWSGDMDAAKGMYEIVLSLDPNHSDAQQRLSMPGE